MSRCSHTSSKHTRDTRLSMCLVTTKTKRSLWTWSKSHIAANRRQWKHAVTTQLALFTETSVLSLFSGTFLILLKIYGYDEVFARSRLCRIVVGTSSWHRCWRYPLHDGDNSWRIAQLIRKPRCPSFSLPYVRDSDHQRKTTQTPELEQTTTHSASAKSKRRDILR